MKLTQTRLLRQVGQGQGLIEMSIDPGQYVTLYAWRSPPVTVGKRHCTVE